MSPSEHRLALVCAALTGELARAESNVQAEQIPEFCVRIADQTMERLQSDSNSVTEENAKLRATLRNVRSLIKRGETNTDYICKLVSLALDENQSQ
jgi:uncharacterized protein YpuA (DUF1002 family)